MNDGTTCFYWALIGFTLLFFWMAEAQHKTDGCKKMRIETIYDAVIPDPDYVVATACTTAAHVKVVSAQKGNKHYLIQGYETWTWRRTCARYIARNT